MNVSELGHIKRSFLRRRSVSLKLEWSVKSIIEIKSILVATMSKKDITNLTY
jgi:hypothetical protein